MHIPYKGASPSIVDLVAGQVEFSFVSLAKWKRVARAAGLKPQ